MSIRNIVLGLLEQKPMSGYDIKVLFQRLSWLIEGPSYGSLYPTLHDLLEANLVTVDVVPGEGRPARKIYRVTEGGRQALRRWMAEPADAQLSIKTFVMQLVLADNFSSDELRAYLARRRQQVTTYLSDEDGRVDTHGRAQEQDLGQRLIYDYSMAVAEAELAWLDDQLAQLSYAPVA